MTTAKDSAIDWKLSKIENTIVLLEQTVLLQMSCLKYSFAVYIVCTGILMRKLHMKLCTTPLMSCCS